MCGRFVWFDNAIVDPELVHMTPELIDHRGLSPNERVKLRLWLIAQRRVEANTPPRLAAAISDGPAEVVAAPFFPVLPPTPPRLAAAISDGLAEVVAAPFFPVLPPTPQSPLFLSDARRRLEFELEEMGDDMHVPLFARATGLGGGLLEGVAASAGLVGAADGDDEISLYLSNLSTEEPLPMVPSLLGAAMTIYEDDASDDDVVITGYSKGTPYKISKRRPRVTFANSPPHIIGHNGGEERAASIVIVVGASPPHKKTRPEDE